MGKQKKSREDLAAENRYLRKGKTAESIASVLNNGIRWIGITATTYFVFKSIKVLAGKETYADINVSAILATPKALNLLPWILPALGFVVGICGIVYGVNQKKLRQDTVERLQGRIKDLEKTLDPKRTSSGLTQRGQTRLEDKQ